MTDLSAFPVTRRWPPQDASKIQYYGFPTPNGRKVSIMLEELGLPYEAHRVSLAPEDVKSPEFTALSPNGKIPALIDPDGPDGAPLGLFESGAILLYLAEKTGQLIGDTATDRHHITAWLMFQMGGVGPMFGQLGWFVKFGGADIEDPRGRDRYVDEAARLLRVLDTALAGRDWLAGAYSIADIATCPWLKALEVYEARDRVGWDDLKHVPRWLARFMDRPAVQRGMQVFT